MARSLLGRGEKASLQFNALWDEESIFRYYLQTLPSEIGRSIGTSTLLAAWNAATYVAQIEDDELQEALAEYRYREATSKVLQRHSGLWFQDESFVILCRRD